MNATARLWWLLRKLVIIWRLTRNTSIRTASTGKHKRGDILMKRLCIIPVTAFFLLLMLPSTACGFGSAGLEKEGGSLYGYLENQLNLTCEDLGNSLHL